MSEMNDRRNGRISVDVSCVPGGEADLGNRIVDLLQKEFSSQVRLVAVTPGDRDGAPPLEPEPRPGVRVWLTNREWAPVLVQGAVIEVEDGRLELSDGSGVAAIFAPGAWSHMEAVNSGNATTVTP